MAKYEPNPSIFLTVQGDLMQIRKSMAMLHSWTGLLLGWLLFTIFFLGSLSYYRQEINAWMQPQFQQIQVNQSSAFDSAFDYLQKNAHQAKSWYIDLATAQNPVNIIYWQNPDDSYTFKQLNPNTAQEMHLAPTQGGDFLYYFHFELFGLPIVLARIIVSFAAFIMLITLISGIITHKKIFIDFFTFRTFKSQRSWLDFHNIVSVIALPFFLTVTFTGLAISFYLYLPNNIQKYYPKGQGKFFEQITQKTQHTSNAVPSLMLNSQQIQKRINEQWTHHPLIDSIQITQPYSSAAQIMVQQKQDHSITLRPTQMTFLGQDGKILDDPRNSDTIAKLYSSMYGLHMVPFAEPIVRLALFFSGILGCLMIASGLLMWSIKRQIQQKNHLGCWLVDRLNITSFLGLPIAVLGYFYTNRIYTLFHSTNQEIHMFFVIWLLCFLISTMIKKQYLWQCFITILIFLATFLPLIDLIVLNNLNLVPSFWQIVKIDVFFWLLAVFGVYVFKNIKPIQQHTKRKKI